MDTQFTRQPKPTLVNVVAWMTLASGIVNLVWGLVAVSITWWTFVCIPFAILPSVLGIFEVIYAAKLLSDPPQAMQPSNTIAILEIICAMALNFFSVVVGILSLVFYNDVTVKDYFAWLNGTLAPVEPVAPVAPDLPAPAPETEPIEEIPAATPEEIAPVEPAPEETPEKPKRSRKVAKK